MFNQRLSQVNGGGAGDVCGAGAGGGDGGGGGGSGSGGANGLQASVVPGDLHKTVR